MSDAWKSYAVGAVVLAGAALVAGAGGLKQKLMSAVPVGLRTQIEKVEAKAAGRSPNGDVGPTEPPKATSRGPFELVTLRKQLKSSVGEGDRDDTPPPVPPAGELEIVHYTAPLGSNVAYVTPVKSGARRPAIVWITGGFGFGIAPYMWTQATRDNDQSARQFRQAGIVTMYPALRGANQNSGHHECFLGEVDDVLAAADFLAQRPDVDPGRIYLGGHSTGGVMALLAAESTDRFRAVFSFGPVADPRQYGNDGCLPPRASEQEAKPRGPVYLVHEIVSPTFIIEGMTSGNGNILPFFKRGVRSAPVQFVEVPGGTHFSVLAPGCEVIAKAILADTGKTPSLDVTAAAIAKAMQGAR